MANRISNSPVPVSSFVDFTSRYRGSQVINYGDAKVLTFTTYKRKPPLLTKNDKYYLITESTQYRPDLVSNLAYGIPSYWWRIMEANKMKDISDFKPGVTIRIPESIL
jgi:hypothetical protein